MTEVIEEKKVILKNWREIIYNERGMIRLSGNAYGHPRFHDGTFIFTSTVIIMGADWAITLNTYYVLEDPATE